MYYIDHLNFFEIQLNMSLNILQYSLNHPWNILGTHFKLPWNNLETFNTLENQTWKLWCISVSWFPVGFYAGSRILIKITALVATKRSYGIYRSVSFHQYANFTNLLPHFSVRLTPLTLNYKDQTGSRIFHTFTY